MIQIIATDAHDCADRPPRLSEARDVAARRVGKDTAERLVRTNPDAVLRNLAPSSAPELLTTETTRASAGDAGGDVVHQ